jgi:hypothetical protein
MRAPLRSGEPTRITAISRITGASWSEDNRIVVGLPGVGLVVISIAGAATPDTIPLDRASLPQFLPGGAAILFSAWMDVDRTGARQLEVITLKDRVRKVLVRNAADAHYVSTGHLVFARSGTLAAVPFNLAKLDIEGSPVVVLDDVMQALNGLNSSVLTAASQVSISGSGDLVYLTGGLTPDRPRKLEWIDRQGRTTPIETGPDRAFFSVRLSPDERSAAVTSVGLSSGVHVLDLARGTMQSLSDSSFPAFTLWSPDGTRVTHRGRIGDSIGLVSSLVDASRPATPVARNVLTGVEAAFWSSDSATLYVVHFTGGLVAVNRSNGSATAVANLPQTLGHPEMSPDGKWLAYDAPETRGGSRQVFVQPWPALDRKWKISVDSGDSPVWTRNGSELVYLVRMPRDTSGEATHRVMSVQVEYGNGTAFKAAQPQELFTALFGSASPLRAFDVTKDGARFIVPFGPLIRAPAGEPRIIVNWFSELQRLSVRQDKPK